MHNFAEICKIAAVTVVNITENKFAEICKIAAVVTVVNVHNLAEICKIAAVTVVNITVHNFAEICKIAAVTGVEIAVNNFFQGKYDDAQIGISSCRQLTGFHAYRL